MKTLYKCTYVQSKPYSLQLGQSLDPGENCPAVQLRNLSFHVSLTNMYIPQTQKRIHTICISEIQMYMYMYKTKDTYAHTYT